MAGKRTVYVSSTFVDLQAHRAVLKTELERAGFDVESMERYPAFDQRPLERCLEDARRCDAYVLILAHRYGFVPQAGDGRELSITQREYESAVEAGRPCLVFCVDPTHDWPAALKDSPRSRAGRRLAAFRRQVEDSHGLRLFADADDLTKQVLSALAARLQRLDGHATAGGFRWPPAWDFAAYIADKCESFAGRDWLLADIAAWQAAGQPRALLVRADFGVGKSAMMAELVRRNPGGTIAAHHFCQHDTQATLDAGVFVQSIAAQLARSLPGYRALVEGDPALQQRLALAPADAASAFEAAVLAPLARLATPPAPRLLLVDALDEALELDADSARRGGSIVALLASRARRFPPWLLVLATTRSNPQVLVPLQHAFGPKEIDAESADNRQDLQRYVLRRAQRGPLLGRLRAAGLDPDALANLLAARSQGKFLYAVRALSDLEDGRLGLDELAGLPPGLDSFYLDAFERRLAPGVGDDEDARGLLGLLAAARDPLPLATVAEVLHRPLEVVQSVQQRLPDFLRLRAGRLAFDHLSLAEWLTQCDADGLPRAGRFHVDLGLARRRLRDWATGRVSAGRGHESDYLLRHLGALLVDDDERREVYGEMLLGSIAWWQARLAQGGVAALLADTEQLDGHPDQPLLQMLLRQCERVLQAWPEQLPAQMAGRLGTGLGPTRRLAALARAARAWSERPAPALHEGWLMPTTGSLRLAPANLKLLPGGGAELALLPDGRIAFDTPRGDLCIWELQGRQPLQTLDGHEGRVRALVASRDGRLASCGMDGMVRSVGTLQGGEGRCFAGHDGPVRSLVSLAGGCLASGGNDGTIRVWGPQPDQEAGVLHGHAGAVRALAALPGDRLVSGGNDGSLRLWDLVRRQELAVLELGGGPVRRLTAAAHGGIVAGTTRGTLHLWDPLQPGQARTLDASHAGAVGSLLPLADGRVVSGHGDGQVLLWTPDTGACIALGRHAGFVRALALLPDGRVAAGATDGSLVVHDLAGRAPPLPLVGHSGWIDSLVALSDGRLVSCANDGTVRLWDPRAGLVLPQDSGHAANVRALAAGPGPRFASAGDDGRIALWEAGARRWLPIGAGADRGLRAVALLGDGGVAALTEDGVLLHWADEAGLPTLRRFDTAAGVPTVLGVLADGRLAAGTTEGRLLCWDPHADADPLVIDAHAHPVRALTVLSDGRLASATREGQVLLWDVGRGTRPAMELRLAPLHSLAGLPDGRLLAGGRDGRVRIVDPAAADAPLEFGLHLGWVTALAALDDGRIVSAASDGTVRCWHPSGTGRRSLFVADAGITALAVVGNLIAAAAEDGTVHLLREAAPARLTP